ncbi:DinB family protein [Croceimicrobium sp.]|uniref:DinB family protein n=1 Tax=Croceimicrobium sp. TaxID=2828340 RepID=UPI003BAAFF48
MNRAEILDKLRTQHQALMAFLGDLNENQIHQQKEGKWSALQNMDHLLKSIQVVNPAVRKPGFLLRQAFGRPNREARTYDGLVQRYQERLQGAEAKAPKQYEAADSRQLNRQEVLKEYDQEVQRLLQYLGKVKEAKLDRTLLPHPLLGKLLMRELFYFMHYHTSHHWEAIKKSVA